MEKFTMFMEKYKNNKLSMDHTLDKKLFSHQSLKLST